MAATKAHPNWNILANVYNNIFRHCPLLKFPLLWVISTSSEQARRLNLEVAYPLFVPVHETIAILI